MRFVNIVLAFALTVVTAGAGSKGDRQVTDLDREINFKIDRAWNEVRGYWNLQREGEATEEDDPQPELARGLYETYAEHPDTKGGERALQAAFAMWGNIGAVEAIEHAIPKIDTGSESWATILHSISNAYARSGRWEEFKELRASLEGELTHPKARSEIYLDIARELVREGEDDEAREYYERVIELDAEPFYVKRAEGNAINLAELRGDVVLIEFWSTTCGPCLPEIAHLKKIHTAHGDDDFTLIGVALDQKAEDVQTLLDREVMSWPQILEDGRFDGEISKLYNVSYIPRSFLIDADGKIVAKDLRAEKLEQAVANALK